MPRYIDADVLCEVLEKRADDEWNKRSLAGTWSDAYRDMIDTIDDEPTADVEPVRHGQWIRGKNKSAFPAKPPAIWYCSCCGEMIRYNDSTSTYQKKKKKVNEVNPRCRRCGAKMDGGKG